MNFYSILISFLVILACPSCSWQESGKLYPFKNEKGVSNEHGKPYSDDTYYFPLELFVDSIMYANGMEVKLDTFSVEWFSRDLYRMEEPILYNKYLDREIYRFTWLRSFHPQVVIRMENHKDKIFLIEKRFIEYISEKDSEMGMTTFSVDSIKLEKYSKVLPKKVWEDFENLLQEKRLYTLPSTVPYEWGNDGSEWILEKHNAKGYYVVNRWSPDERQYSEFRAIGDFLIDISQFKDEERY